MQLPRNKICGEHLNTATGLDGRIYQIEISDGDLYSVLKICTDETEVGYAKLIIENGTATLADIVISDALPHPNGLMRFLFPKLSANNYRGKGLGTLLLKAVCDYLRSRGVQRIQGKMAGDIERLSAWYGKAGFTVDRATHLIARNL